jgi:hypothetical protein
MVAIIQYAIIMWQVHSGGKADITPCKILLGASCTVIQCEGATVNGQITPCVTTSLNAIIKHTSPGRVPNEEVRVAQDNEQSTSAS